MVMEREYVEEVETVPRNGTGRRRQRDIREEVLAWGLAALGSRALVFVTAASCLGMAWWTVVHPSTLGIIATATAAVTVLAPVLIRDIHSS